MIPYTDERTTFYDTGGVDKIVYFPKGDWYSIYPYTPPYTSYEVVWPRQPKRKSHEIKSFDEDGPRNKWKSWLHYKATWGQPPTSGPYSSDVHWSTSGDRWYTAKAEDPFYGWRVGSGDIIGDFDPRLGLATKMYDAGANAGNFIPWPTQLSDLEVRGLRSMYPEIRAELSLVNSFVELKDFASVGHSLKKLESLPRTIKALGKRAKALREILRTTSDSYLQWKFNFGPLLSDIAGIKTALETAHKRINSLLARSEKTQRRHFSFRFLEYKDSETSFGYYDNSGDLFPYLQWGQKVTRHLYYEPSLFHAEIAYNYTYSRFQVQYAGLLALLDAVGVNFNPAIIWNAIPWSFVIDWVAGVSRWLDQFKGANMEPQINILRYLISIRRVRRIQTRYESNGPSSVGLRFGSYGLSDLNLVTETAYRRANTWPGINSITTSGLSLTEFSLGTALVLTRRKVHGRRKSRR